MLSINQVNEIIEAVMNEIQVTGGQGEPISSIISVPNRKKLLVVIRQIELKLPRDL